MSEQTAEKGAADYRAMYEASMRRRAAIEELLDVVLGEDEHDGAGEGIVADVHLALAVAWDQGAQARAQADPATSVRDLNPYRAFPPGQQP